MDHTSGTYFAQAREYRPELGRFDGKDALRYSVKRNLTSLNLYVYCMQNPLYYSDPNGHEQIVVSGGNDDDSAFDYQFIETGIKNLNDLIADGVPADDITWMVVEAGYSSTDLDNFQNTADNLGINYVGIANKEQMIDYINNKGSENMRADDRITYMSFFSHGRSQKYSNIKENQLSFAYNIGEEERDDINFMQSDISRLESDAFDSTLTTFYSCNAGTRDEDGMSFAQAWSNKTGGTSYGIENGRTLYAMINVASSWGLYGGPINIAPMELWHKLRNTGLWQEKQKRKADREGDRGYSEYGSLNYPWMVSLAGDLDVLIPSKFGLFDRGWKEFHPQSCDGEE